MSKSPAILVLSTLTILAASSACRPSELPGQDPAASRAGNPAPSDGSEEVLYEPAYPADVSTEGLSEHDEAQQESSQSHGDGAEPDHDTVDPNTADPDQEHNHGDHEDGH